mmetsp:Transcript_30608/g.90784  ORF Transcript_30608/g.90784 Transcript_30608/m.90784 type:complete len:313 (-) Transcript_30608:916-1854(-)
MRQQLVDCGALERVLLQRLQHEVPRELCERGREAWRLHANLLLDAGALVVVERWEADQQLVRQHAYRPGVNCQSVLQAGLLLVFVRLVLEWAVEHLWCHVLERPGARHRTLLAQVDCQAKVAQLELHRPREEHVFWLDISVHDAVCVEVLEDAQERVQHQLDCRFLRQLPAIPVQQHEQVARLCKFLDQHHLVALLERREQRDDVFMLQRGMELDLAVNLVAVQLAQVGHVVCLEADGLARDLAPRLVHRGRIAGVHLLHDGVVLHAPRRPRHVRRQHRRHRQQHRVGLGRLRLQLRRRRRRRLVRRRARRQ